MITMGANPTWNECAAADAAMLMPNRAWNTCAREDDDGSGIPSGHASIKIKWRCRRFWMVKEEDEDTFDGAEPGGGE
jgi:hypothetical protein